MRKICLAAGDAGSLIYYQFSGFVRVHLIEDVLCLFIMLRRVGFSWSLVVDVGSTFRFHRSELWEHCSGGSNSRQ